MNVSIDVIVFPSPVTILHSQVHKVKKNPLFSLFDALLLKLNLWQYMDAQISIIIPFFPFSRRSFKGKKTYL
jgi:hypothetical protein